MLRERLEHHDEVPPTESVLEELFLDLCRTFGIPLPVCQWPLAAADRSGRVDFVWPDHGLALEVDGRRWHAIQAAFEQDRDRDLALRRAGFDPHRYTHRQIAERAAEVAGVVLDALGRAPVRHAAR